jgi:membrane glycosyltransferase
LRRGDFNHLEVIRQGPQALKKWELKSMIHDTDTVTDLHYRLWSAAEHDLAPFWSLAIKQYNLAKSSPFAHLLAQNEPLQLEAAA